MYLNKVKRRFRESLNTDGYEEISTCSKEEIQNLEQQLGLSLPDDYKEFLLWMGHGAGRFMRGSEFFYEHLPFLHKWACELLEENCFPEPLPEDAFIFYMHQGYQFAFLRTSKRENSPVYCYNEAVQQTTFTISHCSFSEFLLEWVENYAGFLSERID